MPNSNDVESYAASWVFPLLQSLCAPGVSIRPVPDGIDMQHRFGDAWIANHQTYKAVNVELKSEQRHTGNLFLEVFGNLRAGVPGWLYHYADTTRLAYAFNDCHRLYVCEMGNLRRWAHGESQQAGCLYRLEDFPARTQGRYEQHNVPLGRLVPVEVFLAEVDGAKTYVWNPADSHCMA